VSTIAHHQATTRSTTISPVGITRVCNGVVIPLPGGPRRVLTAKAISEILSATVTPPPGSLVAAGVTRWSSRQRAVSLS
jgi:hypothetical protein